MAAAVKDGVLQLQPDHGADIVVVGVPLSRSSISPSGASEFPDTFRRAWKGFTTYNVEEDLDLAAMTALDVGELFNGLDASILQKLAELAQRESHEAGAMLYRPGDPAEDFYILDSGRVEFLIGRGERTAPGGFMLKKGEVFGWAALLDGYPARIASARCLEASSVLRINGKAALAVLEKDPAAGFVVMRRLAALIARYLATSGVK